MNEPARKNKTLNADVIPIFGDKVRHVVQRLDGWINSATGLGTIRDKLTATSFLKAPTLQPEELEALYSQDDMAARVCDVVPEEMLRQGYTLKIEDDNPAEAAEIAKSVQDAADELLLTPKLTEGMVWGRTFGGGILFLGADDGARGSDELSKPLNREAIKTFDHINVMDRRFVHPVEFSIEAALG